MSCNNNTDYTKKYQELQGFAEMDSAKGSKTRNVLHNQESDPDIDENQEIQAGLQGKSAHHHAEIHGTSKCDYEDCNCKVR